MTESAAYVALQDELDRQETELEETRNQLEEAESALADSDAEVAAIEESLSEARAASTEARAALDAELNRPWPQELKDGFVEGCLETEDGLFTAEQQQVICACMGHEVEKNVSLADFLIFSLAAVDPTIEVDPVTGLPVSIDDDFSEAITRSAISCAAEL